MALFERALPLAQQTGDGRLEGQVVNNIGLIHYELGDRRKALGFYERAVPLHRAVGNRRGEANTLHNLANTQIALGEGRKALDYLTAALGLWRMVGEPRDLANTLNSLGFTYAGPRIEAAAGDLATARTTTTPCASSRRSGAT